MRNMSVILEKSMHHLDLYISLLCSWMSSGDSNCLTRALVFVDFYVFRANWSPQWDAVGQRGGGPKQGPDRDKTQEKTRHWQCSPSLKTAFGESRNEVWCYSCSVSCVVALEVNSCLCENDYVALKKVTNSCPENQVSRKWLFQYILLSLCPLDFSSVSDPVIPPVPPPSLICLTFPKHHHHPPPCSVEQVTQCKAGSPKCQSPNDSISHLKANKLQLILGLFTSKCHRSRNVNVHVRVRAMMTHTHTNTHLHPLSLPSAPIIWLISKLKHSTSGIINDLNK